MENSWAKSEVEADTLRAHAVAGHPVNADEVRVTRRLMERVRAIEAEMASSLRCASHFSTYCSKGHIAFQLQSSQDPGRVDVSPSRDT